MVDGADSTIRWGWTVLEILLVFAGGVFVKALELIKPSRLSRLFSVEQRYSNSKSSSHQELKHMNIPCERRTSHGIRERACRWSHCELPHEVL